jgi:hypothetical protein
MLINRANRIIPAGIQMIQRSASFMRVSFPGFHVKQTSGVKSDAFKFNNPSNRGEFLSNIEQFRKEISRGPQACAAALG